MDLARPEIARLEPYASARGCLPDADGLVRLDANESPWPAFPRQESLNRYPEPQPAKLVQRLADLYGVSGDHVLVTRGTDEAIDLVVRVFCRPGEDAILICPPTFGFYRIAAEIQGAEIVSVPLGDDDAVDWTAVAAARHDRVKLVFLCSPNNPTGHTTDPARVLELAEAWQRQIVVVDEAYIEFSETESLATRVEEAPNLVVLRTLSKAYGLAGARCGATLARPEILELMRRVLAPYPIPAPVTAAVLEALTPHGLAVARERIDRIKRSRDALSTALATCAGVRRTCPSDANFLWIEVEDSDALTQRLRSRGILIRQFERNPGFVRISVGTDEENALVLEALGAARGRASVSREAIVSRRTKETEITASIDLDGERAVEIATGIGFYDHMLEQVARHGGFGLRLVCKGDVEVDAHHTVEDCALVLGEALRKALGDKRGIERYGFVLPMDETRAEVLVDLSGRPAAVFEGQLRDARVGGFPTEMVPHVFESLAQSLGAAIHVRVQGANTHHMVEGCFKALGRALRQAIRRSGDDVASTKGVL
jgi:histidinol-phosphate aminotransferase/imidazoleglycerol-phosphate dehydratase/histidinol-phosphatase